MVYPFVGGDNLSNYDPKNLYSVLYPPLTAILGKSIQFGYHKSMAKSPKSNPPAADKKNQLEKLVSIQQAERVRFARSLHDGPTQSIAALTLRINYLRRLSEEKPESLADEMLKLEDSARQITTEMRYLLFTLHPMVLDSAGLVPALKTLAEKVHEAFNLKVNIEIENNAVKKLDGLAQTAVFYIAEEYLTNAGKQKQTAQIWLQLSNKAGKALLEIREQRGGPSSGEPADASTEQSSQIRAWADLIQAEITSDTDPDKGTRIQVLIPVISPL
jgi:signal transduction histidine kinase